MYRFHNLFSGSSGNCSLVQTENVNILIDLGLSCKKINEELKKLNLSLSDIDAVFITHEHSDHCSALKTFENKYKETPVYGTKPTLEFLSEKFDIKNKVYLKSDDYVEIEDLKIHPFQIPHDALCPVAYNIYKEDKKLTIATDIGHINNYLIDNLSGSDFLLLEANYEKNMLIASEYPYNLKQRILGPNGHLSNDEAGDLIKTLSDWGVRNVMLGHLSKQNNLPELAYQTVLNKIINYPSLDSFALTVAKRDVLNDAINI